MTTTTTHGDVTALWAEAQVTALLATNPKDEVPEYGSEQWARLPTEDPRRTAAVIEAAELHRRTVARQRYVDQLADTDPEAWFREHTTDANRHAARMGRTLASMPTAAEMRARRANWAPVREVAATEGWPPVAIPGRPGWRRHLVNGQQTDLPDVQQRRVA